MAQRLDARHANGSVAQLIPRGEYFMRYLLAATASIPASAGLASAAPPALTPAQHDATHAMFEHIINLPTVIGRHRVPEEAQYVADQFKAGGFPAEDIHVLP